MTGSAEHAGDTEPWSDVQKAPPNSPVSATDLVSRDRPFQSAQHNMGTQPGPSWLASSWHAAVHAGKRPASEGELLATSMDSNPQQDAAPTTLGLLRSDDAPSTAPRAFPDASSSTESQPSPPAAVPLRSQAEFPADKHVGSDSLQGAGQSGPHAGSGAHAMFMMMPSSRHDKGHVHVWLILLCMRVFCTMLDRE